MTRPTAPIRSWLYVPGDRPDRLDAALATQADAVVLDLEDTVVDENKQAARDAVAATLHARAGEPGPALWVRVNSGAVAALDFDVLGRAHGLGGVVVAKATTDSTWAAAGWARERGVPVSPLLETARGILDAREIAQVPGVLALQIGEYDLAAALNLRPSHDDAELLPYRAQVVLASAAARIAPPPAPLSLETADLGAYRASCERVSRAGFWGRACSDPMQVAVVHETWRIPPEK